MCVCVCARARALSLSLSLSHTHTTHAAHTTHTHTHTHKHSTHDTRTHTHTKHTRHTHDTHTHKYTTRTRHTHSHHTQTTLTPHSTTPHHTHTHAHTHSVLPHAGPAIPDKSLGHTPHSPTLAPLSGICVTNLCHELVSCVLSVCLSMYMKERDRCRRGRRGVAWGCFARGCHDILLGGNIVWCRDRGA